LCRLATTGLIWIPCSRCNMQWAKWLAFQFKDLASEAQWLSELGDDAAG
jgi:hypothetical protein